MLPMPPVCPRPTENVTARSACPHHVACRSPPDPSRRVLRTLKACRRQRIGLVHEGDYGRWRRSRSAVHAELGLDPAPVGPDRVGRQPAAAGRSRAAWHRRAAAPGSPARALVNVRSARRSGSNGAGDRVVCASVRMTMPRCSGGKRASPRATARIASTSAVDRLLLADPPDRAGPDAVGDDRAVRRHRQRDDGRPRRQRDGLEHVRRPDRRAGRGRGSRRPDGSTANEGAGRSGRDVRDERCRVRTARSSAPRSRRTPPRGRSSRRAPAAGGRHPCAHGGGSVTRRATRIRIRCLSCERRSDEARVFRCPRRDPSGRPRARSRWCTASAAASSREWTPSLISMAWT